MSPIRIGAEGDAVEEGNEMVFAFDFPFGFTVTK